MGRSRPSPVAASFASVAGRPCSAPITAPGLRARGPGRVREHPFDPVLGRRNDRQAVGPTKTEHLGPDCLGIVGVGLQLPQEPGIHGSHTCRQVRLSTISW